MNAPAAAPADINVSEKMLVGLIGAVQFVNILDFMMVMPLGPDFAKALAIPQSSLGLVGGSYTAAAAVSGVAGAFFLDKFDRKRALVLAMAGLVVGTLLGALAWDLPSLLFARVVAGIFGGPATSVSLSIIADVIPLERRGRAMGAVMGAFSASSVLGVPAGLELARLGGWRAPFIGVASLGALVVALAAYALPNLVIHLRAGPPTTSTLTRLRAIFARPVNIVAYVALGLSMMSGFSLIPNISAHLQQNLLFPREHLWILYLVGGSLAFFTMRLAGRVVDKAGSHVVNIVAVVAFSTVVYLGFIVADASMAPVAELSVGVLFACFMLAQTTRNVALNTLMSKVPPPQERAGFLSVQSATSHMASALGAMTSSKILTDGPHDTVVGVPQLAVFAIALSICTPPFVWLVERTVRQPPLSRDASS